MERTPIRAKDLKTINEDLDYQHIFGEVTGISDIINIDYAQHDSELRLGFFLDNELYCSINSAKENNVLKAHAWLDQNRNKEVIISGKYSPREGVEVKELYFIWDKSLDKVVFYKNLEPHM